jgi:HCOMODA/2-hydroxy-3-carboxy-muconic semialdehyde decarboxylase
MMTAAQRLDKAKFDLMAANRILAHENVVDGYGHVSVRHPDDPQQFLLSRSRSPELVTVEDIMTFTLDGKPVGGDARPGYLERTRSATCRCSRSSINPRGWVRRCRCGRSARNSATPTCS